MPSPPSPLSPRSDRSARSPDRLRWPDVAKGACILLVVVHHVVVKDYEFLVSGPLEPVARVWHGLTYALKPVRMPLFFAISGFFAAGAVARPWRSSWRRVVAGYYLYVVWLAVFAVVYALDRDVPANRVVSGTDLLGELAWAASSMWFLYALVVYFVIAKLVSRLPPAPVVAAAAVLAASASFLGVEENNRYSVLVHLVYFLAGAAYPQVLRRVAERRVGGRALLAAVAGYAVAATVVLGSGLPTSVTALGASLIGIPLGVRLAVRGAETRAGRALAWVGRRTLRVYVLHLVVLVALLRLPLALPERGFAGLVATVGYPLAMSAVVVAGCFAAHRVLVAVGGGWLFALPDAVGQRLDAAGTGQPTPAGARKVPSVARSGITG